MSDRIEIVKELRALEKFCAFPPSMSGEDRERFLKDYLADVQEFPLEAIQAACADWRRSGSTRFPTSGQLIALIRNHTVQRTGPKLEEWRELSEEQYQRLSLNEKIRHHRILAHQASRKAGPMWLDGKPALAEEMPSSWHRWKQIAQNHLDEVTRLRKFMRHEEARA